MSAEEVEPIPSPSAGRLLLVTAVLATSFVGGAFLASSLVPAVEQDKLSWVLGRGLGLASFISLSVLVIFGTWVRHPLRQRIAWPTPKDTLAIHASLGAATFTMVAAHLTALALDPWAKVGWVGALVPFASSFKPSPMALGTLAVWGMLLVGATSRMAGRLGRASWLRVHRLSYAIWASALLHGITTGSDTAALTVVYGAAAGLVVLASASARLVPAPARTRPARAVPAEAR